MLSEKAKNNIAGTLRKIESGLFDYDAVNSLFMNLRDPLLKKDKQGYEVLYDIFDAVAHPEQRDRGIIFKYAKNIINDFINAIKFGGIVTGKVATPNLDEAFEKIFTSLKITYNKTLFNNQTAKIKDIIYENILKDTKLCIENNDIESCFVVKKEDNLFISFKMKPFCYTQNGLTIQGNPTIQFPLRLM